MPRLAGVGIVTAPAVAARRPRAFVGVAGPQAADYLNRMVSNDVLALASGASCEALLLTAKARVIATLRVVRRGEEDFLLLTEPELGETVRSHLLRFRFAARCEIAPEEHDSYVLLGPAAAPPHGALAVPDGDYGVPGYEVVGEAAPAGLPLLGDEELERLRIEAGTPRFGRDIDDRVLPAEAGLDRLAVSFTKGCYPGQEPVARLHFRGHPNRELRVLAIESGSPPAPGAEVVHAGRAVGRVTSAARAGEGAVALAYVRVEVPVEAPVGVGGAAATMTRPTRP
jgi:folate-binding protein YgfZ